MDSFPINELAVGAYITFSFVIVGFIVAPIYWHFKHNNSGPASLGLSILIGNLTHGINSIIWRHDAINRAPIWCDITAKIILVYSTACLCGALCIARFIASAVAPQSVHITARRMRRTNTFNYCFCLGAPIVMMAAQIVYQPHRFVIARTVGCQASYVISWPTFLLWLIWPPILAILSAAYAAYAARRIWLCRSEMRKLIEPSGMPTSRFFRIVAICSGYAAFSLPLTLFTFVRTIQGGGGYVQYNWDLIHGTDDNFNTPLQFPLQTAPVLYDCLTIMGGAVYVAFFSFSKEAGSVYTGALQDIGLAHLVSKWTKPKSLPLGSSLGRVTEISLAPSEGLHSEYSHKSHDSEPAPAYEGPFGVVGSETHRGGKVVVNLQEQIV